MPETQMRLLPQPRPLLDRFGKAFFRRAPAAPGVYLMSDRTGRLLYVGQSRNLRVRLRYYTGLKPERGPRRLIRLIHETTSITWELQPTAEAAIARERELLRLFRPRFNRADLQPDWKVFFGIVEHADRICLRLTQAQDAVAPGETSYGPFRGLVGPRELLRTLAQIVVATQSGNWDPRSLPRPLLLDRPPRSWSAPRLPLPSPAPEWPSWVGALLEHGDLAIARHVESTGQEHPGLSGFGRAFWAAKVESLEAFAKARSLRAPTVPPAPNPSPAWVAG